jgi:hypothetical protein
MVISMSMQQMYALEVVAINANTASAPKIGNRLYNGGGPKGPSGGSAVKAAAVKGANVKGGGLRRRRHKTKTSKEGTKLAMKKIFKGVATKDVP